MAVASPPPAQESSDDEQIDAALEVIRGIRPDLYDQAIDKWNALDAAGDADGLDHLAIRIVHLAARLEAKQLQEQPQQPKAQPKERAQPKAELPPVPVPAPPSDLKRVLGVIAWCFGALLWVPGSRYALDGWTLAVNVVLGVARLNVTVPLATGIWSLLLFVVGYLYSVGEQRYIPVRFVRTKTGRRLVFLGWGVVLAWLLVNSTDWGATYLGATTIADDAWPVTRWMGRTLWASITWTTVLTYVPEILFILGARWLGLHIQWPWNRRKR